MCKLIDNKWTKDEKIVKTFQGYRDTIVGTYILWLNNLDLQDAAPYTEARTCVESVLKALIVEHFEIANLDNGDYGKLKNMGLLFGKPQQFGTGLCLSIISDHTKLLSAEILEFIDDINKVAIKHTHQGKKLMNRTKLDINYKLYLVVNSFFKTFKELDWHEKYISEHLNDLNSIARTLEDVKKHYERESNSSKKLKLKLAIYAFITVAIVVSLLFFTNTTLSSTESGQPNNTKNDNVCFSDTTENSFKILVLPFRNVNNNIISSIGGELASKLEENDALNRQNVEIKYLETYTNYITPSVASELRRKTKANIVIWGKDLERKNDQSHNINFKYISASPVMLDNRVINKTEDLRLGTISEIGNDSLYLEINDVIYWCLAMKYLNRRDNQMAIENFKKVTKGKFHNLNLFGYLAMCYVNLGDENMAEQSYEQALRIDSSADAHFQYASFLSFHLWPKNGKSKKTHLQNEKIEEQYEKSIQLDSTNWRFSKCYAEYLFFHLKEYGKSRSYFEKALKIVPKNPVLLTEYAILLSSKFSENSKANECFKMAIQMDSTSRVTNATYADFLYVNLNDFRKAKYYYERILRAQIGQINSSSTMLEIYFNYALLLIDKFGNINEARKCFEEGIERFNYDAKFHYYYAVLLYYKFDEKNLGYEEYKKAIELDSTIKIHSPFISTYGKLNPIMYYDSEF